MAPFRGYFNRSAEAPQVASVDEGSQASEINVLGFVAEVGCRVVSCYNGNPVNRDTPSFWVEIFADRMEVQNGIAHFYAEPGHGDEGL